jgi:hypothetical protein
VEWPIDTSAFSFMGSLPPEPVVDHQTKRQKTGANGEPLLFHGADVLLGGGR